MAPPAITEHDDPSQSHKFRLFGLSQLAIAVVTSTVWMAISSGLIILNKQLLSSGFHYPMALSALGMSFSSIASFLCCRVFRIVEAKKNVSMSFYVERILPVGLFMALTLHFGNLVYLYLTVAFIQMLKAVTPIITMLALFVAGLESPTRPLIASVTIIAFGTAIASVGEVNLDITGVLIMLASEAFESIRLVMTQVLLTGLKFHPIEGLMYLAPACTFWLLLGSFVLERHDMMAEGAWLLVRGAPVQFFMAAIMGFAVNSLAYIVIQTASSLTLKVLGTVKNAMVVVIGVVALHEKVTFIQGVGYALSLAAFFWYQQIKTKHIAQSDGRLSSHGNNGGSSLKMKKLNKPDNSNNNNNSSSSSNGGEEMMRLLEEGAPDEKTT